jgi:hypothetical protein
MKRDMELIRQILCSAEALEYEDGEPHELYRSKTPTEAYQIALMKDASLLDAEIGTTNRIPSEAVIFRLTWAGHDFLDSSRDSKIWRMAVDHVIKPGASWSFSILVEWLKREAQRQLGIPTSSCADSTSDIQKI